MSGKVKAKHSKKFGRTFKMTARNKRTKISSSPDGQFSRAFDFSSNAQGLNSLVGRKNSCFWKKGKQENTKNLRRLMRPRKNHEEPQKHRSWKNLRYSSNWKQKTTWHTSVRAPLAQSVEHRYFIPIFKGLSLLYVAKILFFHRTESKKT